MRTANLALRPRAPLSLLCAALLSLPVTAVRAQPAEAEAASTLDESTRLERAKAHYSLGEKAYLSGDYDLAHAEFELAYQLSRRPALLYNLAQVSRRAGKREEAARYLAQYLESSPDDADAVRKELAKLSPEPLPAPAPPPSPPAPVEIVKPAPPPSGPSWGPRFAAPLLLGLGGAGLLTGAALLGVGQSVDPSVDAAAQARARSLTSSGVFLVVTGAALGIGGATLYVIQRRQAR